MYPGKQSMVLNRALCLLQYDGRSHEEVANMSFEERRRTALKGLQNTRISSEEGGSQSSTDGSGTGQRGPPAPHAVGSGSSQSPSERNTHPESRHGSGQDTDAGRRQDTDAGRCPASRQAAASQAPQQATRTQLDPLTAANPFAAVQHSDRQQQLQAPKLDPLTAASPFATVGQQPQLDPLMAASHFATLAQGLSPESDTH